MSVTVQSSDSASVASTPSIVFGERWRKGAAVVRILFGLLWAVDAAFKWLPGFISGRTLSEELGQGAKVHTPVVHQWLELWNTVGLVDPAASATVIAIVETFAAAALIFGVLSNAAFIGTAVWSFGIWSGAEAFHLPFHDGMTDLGPSVGYVFASLALFFAAAGSTWSVDTWLRPRLGRLGWLAAPNVGATSVLSISETR
jgi:thiosulfate dehydrogenase (quinone) large subunit